MEPENDKPEPAESKAAEPAAADPKAVDPNPVDSRPEREPVALKAATPWYSIYEVQEPAGVGR